MRDDLDRLLAKGSLVTLGLGIALGWSLFQVAKGVADLVNGLLTDYPRGADVRFVAETQPLTWVVGDRVLTFSSLLTGMVELAIVLLVAVLALRRRSLPTPE